MMKIFATAEWKKASQKLDAINIKQGGWKEVTEYSQVQYLVSNQMRWTNNIDPYLKAMKKSELAPELILKYLVVIHTYLQQAERIQQNKLIEFMNYLLPNCEEIVQKFSQVSQKKDNSFLSKTMGPKSSTSTSEDTFMSKQVLLINGIIKPYISLLLKILSILQEYKDLKERADKLEDYQAWMLINLLKMMAGIVYHFSMIGRYFIKQYGHLVILLTRALASDVARFISLLKSHTTSQNGILSSLYQAGNDTAGRLQSYISMMEEISKLNQPLMQMYLGKYFYKYVLDLPEPKWFNTSSNQYDEIYKLWRMTHGGSAPNQTKESVFETKKRSRSLNLPSSKKGHARVRADNNNDDPFSYLF